MDASALALYYTPTALGVAGQPMLYPGILKALEAQWCN